jgi:hypothetical protein
MDKALQQKRLFLGQCAASDAESHRSQWLRQYYIAPSCCRIVVFYEKGNAAKQMFPPGLHLRQGVYSISA